MTSEHISPVFGEPKLEEAIAGAIAQMNALLCVAAALDADLGVRKAVLRGASRVAFDLPAKTGFAIVEPNRFGISRSLPEGCPRETPARLWGPDSVVRGATMPRRWKRYEQRAEDLVRALLRDDRAAFRGLLGWAPLVETQAYLFGARLTELVDATRPRILAASAKDELAADAMWQLYLKATTMLGRANLLATTPGASAWLVDMARSFAWRTWTPSLAMTRERGLWLALVGARAAAAFGPALLDNYFGALARAKHPVVALDAIISLTAIGLSHPGVRDDVARRLEAVELSTRPPAGSESPFASAGRDQALELLRRPPDARKTVFEPASFDEGSLLYAVPGGYPLLARLPDALAAPAWSFIPSSGARPLTIGPRRARQMMARAWGTGAPELGSGTVH